MVDCTIPKCGLCKNYKAQDNQRWVSGGALSLSVGNQKRKKSGATLTNCRRPLLLVVLQLDSNRDQIIAFLIYPEY